jgi:RNA 2',3'-cyclic 3'-phosphodiesterase
MRRSSSAAVCSPVASAPEGIRRGSERGERLRLFVAAPMPGELLERVAALMQPLKHHWPGARWTDTSNQHVTLKFLGWVDEGQLEAIRASCDQVASSHRAAELALGVLGAFPSKTRVRVLWIDIEDASGLLARLAGALDDALEPLGFEIEKRGFTPHLTLARLKTPLRMTAAWPDLDLEREPWTCDELVLFRSHLSPKGARYEIVDTFGLTGS